MHVLFEWSNGENVMDATSIASFTGNLKERK